MDADKKQIVDNQLNEIIYSSNLLNWNFIILGIISLILGFVFNIPLKEKVTDIITSKLSSSEQCPIFYERIEVGSFLQNVNLTGPIISGTCLGRQNSIRFDSILANFSIPSLSPPGVKIHLLIRDNKSEINLFPVISYPKTSLEINETNIKGELIQKLIGGSLQISGDFKIESNLEMEKGDLLDGGISILSKNLIIPRQTISGFNIPPLLLRNFEVKGDIEQKNNVEISSIIIGDSNSMIFTQLKGKLTLNSTTFSQSNLDLTGKIKFSKEFINSFPILNLLLSGKTPGQDGLYNIKLQGPILSLKPSIF